MTETERRTKYYDDPDHREGLCISCRFFYQHYLRRGCRNYWPMDFGHCVQSRITKHRRAYDTCERYERKETL